MAWQERRLALQEQDVAIMKTVKSELARVPELEKELKNLREDNAFLRSDTFSCVDWTSNKSLCFQMSIQSVGALQKYEILFQCSSPSHVQGQQRELQPIERGGGRAEEET